MLIAAIITSIATVIIAWYAYCNYRLYKVIQEKDAEYKEQISDLYQAIVIATLLSGPSSYGGIEEAIKEFNRHYKGKTKVF